jgi:hypothetical protein
MATANQVISAADDLIQALQDLVDDNRFAEYRDGLTGAVTDLAVEREDFAGRYAGDVSKPGFSGVRTKLRNAKSKANAASPTDSSMSALGRSVDSAINALRNA